MKYSRMLLSLAVALCQTPNLAQAAVALGEPVVSERGPDHRRIETVTEKLTPYFRRIRVTNSFVELASSMHYRDDQGNWSESKSLIELFPPDGAVARHGPMQVIFAANARTAGGLDVSVDGKRFRSHVIGIAYAEADTGRAVLVAELQDSIAQLVGNNEIWYPDALVGEMRADIQYVYNIYGLEQNIVVRESADPAAYGLNPATVRVQVLTEWVEAPEPTKQTVVLKTTTDPVLRAAMVDPDLIEERLQFGSVIMPAGAAFPLGQEAEPITTGKTWETRESRRLLIEQTDFSDIKMHLDRLPQAAAARTNPKELMARVQAGVNGAKGRMALPPAPPRQARVQGRIQPVQMAALSKRGKGFVLDYQLLNANTNDFTFRGDTTYYVSSQVILTGTTTIEGGSVIKCTNANVQNKRIWLQGPLDCRTSSYRPAIWTGKSDDTVGEVVAGSTGNPTTNYFGLYLDLSGNTNVIDLHDVTFRYAYYAINLSSVCDLTLSHSRIGYSYAALVNGVGRGRLRNVLIHDGGYALGGTAPTDFPQAENVTFHRLNYLRSSGTSYLTNCLIMAVTNNLLFTGTNNETNINDSGVFQGAGYGTRYLTNNSPFRNAGTTNINPTLLSDLRKLSTYPPLWLTNDVMADTTLTPQAQRDTDTIDLGAHYLPIDWLVGGISVTGATLTVKGGAVVAIDCASTNWGIRLQSGGALVSEGDPLNLNRFVRTHSVQEVPAGIGNGPAPLFADTHPPPPVPATFKLRFTDVAQIQIHSHPTR